MKPETASRFQGTSSKYPPQYYDENPDHSQPVRTQQNFYPGGADDYGKRPESAGNK